MICAFLLECCNEFCAAVVVFRYKPDSSHHHLYPAKKDDRGNPVQVILDGVKTYEVCDKGIEVFATKDGPYGVPALAKFATAANNSSLPRFDPTAVRANVMTIIKKLKDSFTADDHDEWNSFFDAYPSK
eukprot:3722189-Pleurochrysis_carterae.AAC.1